MKCSMQSAANVRLTAILAGLLCLSMSAVAAELRPGSFPPALGSYAAAPDASLFEVLRTRVNAEPFNLVATVIFVLAIIHTFLAPMFLRLAHRFEHEHQARLANSSGDTESAARKEVSFKAEMFHFLGEVEAVFGVWVVPLMILLAARKGWPVARDYIGADLKFTEPMFVVVIMTMAASRPVLEFSERLMAMAARLGRGSLAAWWLAILTLGPLLGSFITEPAAMTICALLLADKFYRHSPSTKFAYATLGLLFVNISVGGTLTHFAAPPVLMVAAAWKWDLMHMLTHFGWKAAIGIVIANAAYFALFRKEFKTIAASAKELPDERTGRAATVPAWITAIHLLFLAWTVVNNHFPALFIGGFLFYIAFTLATEQHQRELALRPAMLVGFFLAGLVIHGGLQGWWIEPVLTRLSALPLFFGAVALTAFNDNAAITYLASLVPGFSDALKYAVVAGAVAGGGLTVIANAPNPAGQSILSRFFPDGVSPLRLFLGALPPTLVMSAALLLLR